jgi:hypothetical protein
VTVEVGGVPVRLRTEDDGFAGMLRERYAGFLNPSARTDCELEVRLLPPDTVAPEEDVRVYLADGRWRIERGDFRAEFDPLRRHGTVRQTANPYSIDSVLRIVHTLLLVPLGGFLLHASSAVRNGRAFLFAGVSGAGKTTMARLAPPDVTLLTDEISYVRPEAGGYRAFGTPFAGDLERAGENVSAPVGALYFLVQGGENRIEPVAAAEAARALPRNILFFAEDAALVKQVFENACAFAAAVPAFRLTFVPDPGVWELIG